MLKIRDLFDLLTTWPVVLMSKSQIKIEEYSEQLHPGSSDVNQLHADNTKIVCSLIGLLAPSA